MNKNKINQIFTILKRTNPNPTTELKYDSNFELLIAVILSAQATDVSVNKACAKLFKRANTPKQILQLGEKELIQYIKSIGLYQTKAKHIIKTCQMLLDKYHNQIPSSREQLETLPGVGRKTANVILNTAFHQPVIAVDTHVFRVANRLNLVCEKTMIATEKKLMEVINEQFKLNAHHWLILHGRYICTARKPKCAECMLYDLCEYPDKTC